MDVDTEWLNARLSTQEAFGPVVLSRVVELLLRRTLRSKATDTGKLRSLSRELIKNIDQTPSP